jgi:ACR3 family arsenite efflux pump ArsB
MLFWIILTIVVWCLGGVITGSIVDLISQKQIKYNFLGAYCLLGLIIPFLLIAIKIDDFKIKKIFNENKTGIRK